MEAGASSSTFGGNIALPGAAAQRGKSCCYSPTPLTNTQQNGFILRVSCARWLFHISAADVELSIPRPQSQSKNFEASRPAPSPFCKYTRAVPFHQGAQGQFSTQDAAAVDEAPRRPKGPYERPEFGVVQYEERQFIFAALERHWSWAVGFVGYPIPNFPQSFWQEPAPPMNHAPRPTDVNFLPEAARGAVPSPRHLAP